MKKTAWMLVRWLLTPVKLFLGYDVFVSYARADGGGYVDALLERLTTSMAPRSDLHEAKPSTRLPISLVTAVVLSRVLVIVSTPKAATSAAVDAEVRWFVRLSGGPVLPIELGAAAPEAIWWAHIAGVPRIGREQDAFRIKQCVGFWARSRRLACGLSTLGLILALVIYLAIDARNHFSAFSDVEQASRLSDPDSDGDASAARVLFAIRSSMTAHNGAALQIMSEELSHFSMPIVGWGTDMHVTGLALDARGRHVARSDGKTIAVFFRNGDSIGRFPLPDPGQPVHLAFTPGNSELVVLNGGQFCRGRVDRWAKAFCKNLGKADASLLSYDGEGVALQQKDRILLTKTTPDAEPRILRGQALCFDYDLADNYLITLEVRPDGSQSIIENPLLTDSYRPDPITTKLPDLITATLRSWGRPSVRRAKSSHTTALVGGFPTIFAMREWGSQYPGRMPEVSRSIPVTRLLQWSDPNGASS